MKCVECGATDRHLINSPQFGMVCSPCYQRNRISRKVYDLPAYGEIAYSEEGKPICHVCGRAYDKVIAHARQVHKLNKKEYKKKFGLETTKGIMSEKSTEIASQRNAEHYARVVEENLLVKGKETRYEKGSEGRTRDKVSKYTRNSFAERARRRKEEKDET